MSLRPPGGALTGLSILWLAYAAYCFYLSFRFADNLYLLFGAAVGFPTAGIWYGWRPAGWILLALFGLSIPLALIALFTIDVTWTDRFIRLLKIGAAIYFAFVVYQWAQDS